MHVSHNSPVNQPYTRHGSHATSSSGHSYLKWFRTKQATPKQRSENFFYGSIEELGPQQPRTQIRTAACALGASQVVGASLPSLEGKVFQYHTEPWGTGAHTRDGFLRTGGHSLLFSRAPQGHASGSTSANFPQPWKVYPHTWRQIIKPNT